MVQYLKSYIHIHKALKIMYYLTGLSSKKGSSFQISVCLFIHVNVKVQSTQFILKVMIVLNTDTILDNRLRKIDYIMQSFSVLVLNCFYVSRLSCYLSTYLYFGYLNPQVLAKQFNDLRRHTLKEKLRNYVNFSLMENVSHESLSESTLSDVISKSLHLNWNEEQVCN